MTDEALVQVEDEEEPFTSAWDLLTDEPLTLEIIKQFKGKLYRSMNEFDHVREQLGSIPANATGASLVRLAVGTWSLGRHADAIPLMKKLGDAPGALYCIAISQVALGKPGEARETIGKLKAKSPKHPDVQALEVSTYEGAHDWAGMKKALDSARELAGTAWGHYFQGRLAEEDRRIEEALDLYEQALSIDENHAEALFRLGYVLDLRGLDEQAIHFYERTTRCIPPNVAALVNLGILYEDMGRYRRAMHLYDFVLRTYPSHARARLFRRDSHASLSMYYDEDQERREDKRNQVLRIPITDFELSVRSRNCLSKMNIRTLGDLVKKTEAELLSYKNFGETSLNEIKEILKSKNLRLGMDQEDLLDADLESSTAVATPPAEPSAIEGVGGGDVTQRPVADLELSVRSRRIIDLLKVKTIGDLSSKTEAELLACPNFGQTSLNEIKAKLEELGLALKG